MGGRQSAVSWFPPKSNNDVAWAAVTLYWAWGQLATHALGGGEARGKKRNTRAKRRGSNIAIRPTKATTEFALNAKMAKLLSALKWKAGSHAKAKIYQSTNIDGSIYGSTNLSIMLSIQQCINLSIYHSNNIPNNQSINLSIINLPIYRSTNLSIFQSINLPTYQLSIYQ